MDFLTDEKLVIVGAAGMIGSNMAQTAAMMRLTPTYACMIHMHPDSRVLLKKCTTVGSRVSTLRSHLI